MRARARARGTPPDHQKGQGKFPEILTKAKTQKFWKYLQSKPLHFLPKDHHGLPQRLCHDPLGC
jgi:hypothetical protein